MSPVYQLRATDDLTAAQVDALEDRLYAYNAQATDRDDAHGIGFVVESQSEGLLGAAAGYSWAGVAELQQLWVADAHRGQGLGRQLLDAFIGAAAARGARRVFLATYDFQAPEFYERAGFVRIAELVDWPEGHSNIIRRLDLSSVEQKS